MKTNKQSFKKVLSQYSIFAIVILSFITIAQYSLMLSAIQRYDDFLHVYEDLSHYYSSQSQAHVYFQDFLYERSEETYTNYESEIANANNASNTLKEDFYTIGEKNVVWRFDLLQNMIISYQKTADQFKNLEQKSNQFYKSTYDELQHIYKIIMESSDEYYDMVTINVMEIKGEVDQNKQVVLSFSLILLLACIAGVCSYLYSLLKSITKPIGLLVDNIQDIKIGNYDLHKVPVDTNEMEVLCVALQDLADNIRYNVEGKKEKLELEKKLLLQENENLRKDETLAQSEVKILQTQLHPHFVFNTLNMIYLQAIKEGALITINMLEKMSECMRYTLNQKYLNSNLYLEIAFIRNYLYIQSNRFEDRIQFELSVQEDVPNITIPAMIIEPIIENSLKHGLCNAAEDGMITIFITFDERYVYIKVSDNGKGIAPELAEEMMHHEFESGNSKKDNLGLANITKRIKILYAKEAFISVSGMEGCGFETLITIPIHKEDCELHHEKNLQE